MKEKILNPTSGRRRFLQLAGLGAGAGILGINQACNQKTKAPKPKVEGFEDSGPKTEAVKVWTPFSDRKVRVGLVGYGACKFAAQFGFQDHPNVEVVAVSDLFPDRCAKLAEVTRCSKTYPSLEELVKDDSIEAVFVATDAPSHKKHCIEVLNHGKHVATAVPAVFGSLEDAEELFEVVKRSGLKYMMYETSCFRADLYAMRQIYKAGGFGKIVYAEGEYYHGPGLVPGPPLGSYKNWRDSMPPQWYPTHSNAYYVGVTDLPFVEVSCIGNPYLPDGSANNQYNNPFRDEIALFRTQEGGIARMARTRTPGMASEVGRVQGEKGSYDGKYVGYEKNLPDLTRPALPPGVEPGGHGGSHGQLTNEFITAIIEDRKPLVDIAMALNMTVSGIVAHQSALKDGEWLKVPQYEF
jgi:predicted dehydrogenase